MSGNNFYRAIVTDTEDEMTFTFEAKGLPQAFGQIEPSVFTDLNSKISHIYSLEESRRLGISENKHSYLNFLLSSLITRLERSVVSCKI